MLTLRTVVTTSFAVQEFRLFGHVTVGSVAPTATPTNPVQIQRHARTARRLFLATVPPPVNCVMFSTWRGNYRDKGDLYRDVFARIFDKESCISEHRNFPDDDHQGNPYGGMTTDSGSAR